MTHLQHGIEGLVSVQMGVRRVRRVQMGVRRVQMGVRSGGVRWGVQSPAKGQATQDGKAEERAADEEAARLAAEKRATEDGMRAAAGDRHQPICTQ